MDFFMRNEVIRRLTEMNIEQYGYQKADTIDCGTGIPARVTAVHRSHFEIVCDRGTGLARLKTGEYYGGNENVPATGDFVLVNWQEGSESLILKTLPRKTYFARLDPSSSGYGEQAVAANFDYVFIMQALDRDFNPRRLERYLTLAWQSGATPAVILTKADEAKDPAVHVLAAEKIAAGADVYAVSAKTGQGISELSKYMKPGRTTVFLGSSGVGKSTLVNALAGEAIMETGAIREKDGRGRHTTSHRQLVLLKNGAIIIDTPGMRELGMWDVSEGLGQSFADVEQYLGRCRFNDCRHQREPGCAVKAAIQSGELPAKRWESYLKLLTEARFADDKAGYLKEKRQWHKSISKMQKSGRNADYRIEPCTETFTCRACKRLIAPEDAGSSHRNHCPHCLTSIHADNQPGDRASLCKGMMEPVSVWVKKNGEWAVIHKCRSCGTLSSNRIAADDNMYLLMEIAMKPLYAPLCRPGEAEEEGTKSAESAAKANSRCQVCGSPVNLDREKRRHCPDCLSGVHTDEDRPGDGASLCRGVLEPVGVWAREDGRWEIIHRCRSCGTLSSDPVAAADNTTLLLSIAMRPLASPPFPLWQLRKEPAD